MNDFFFFFCSSVLYLVSQLKEILKIACRPRKRTSTNTDATCCSGHCPVHIFMLASRWVAVFMCCSICVSVCLCFPPPLPLAILSLSLPQFYQLFQQRIDPSYFQLYCCANSINIFFGLATP